MARPPRTDDLRRELEDLEGVLRTVVGALPALPDEDAVWRVYAGVEKNVTKLKLRLGVERPGVFQEIPTSKVPDGMLGLALELMGQGLSQLDGGDLLGALDALRKARNYLRGYLAERRKVRMREKRVAAAARRSSSP